MAQQTAGPLMRVCAALAILIASTWPCKAQAVAPIPAQSKLQAFESGVVRVRTQSPSGEPALEGWGLIVGDSGGILTIATPCHVVWKPCDPAEGEPSALTDTPAVLFQNSSRPAPARRQSARFPGDDLAILTAYKPASFTTIPLPILALGDAPRLMEVRNLGSAEGVWDLGGPGHYQGQDPKDGRLRITELPTPPGSSGSLALTDYGVLGMVLSNSGLGGGNTYVIPGGRIRELVQGAGFEVNLLTSAPPPPPPTPTSIEDLVVGPGITTPTLPVVPSVWQTVRSTYYRTPSSRTTLTLSGASGGQGPATLEDTKLGTAQGSFTQKGWTIGFTSAKVCASGEMYGDTRTGLNIMQFQMTPLYCRSGGGNCACYGSDMVQSNELTTSETLVQTSANAPTARPGAPPPPPDYRPPSDVSGETWAFTYAGHEIRVAFAADKTVTFSSDAFGSYGRWQPNGRQYVTITTQSFTIQGTLASTPGFMVINIGRKGSFESVASGLEMRRVSGAATANAGNPPYVLPAPDMQPGPHLGGQTWVFDVGGQPLVISFQPDHQAVLSDARYGSAGTWTPIGSTGFTLKTDSHGLIGWFTQNGSGEVVGCHATITPLYGAHSPGQVVACRRAP
jgi:hypothetical protein